MWNEFHWTEGHGNLERVALVPPIPINVAKLNYILYMKICKKTNLFILLLPTTTYHENLAISFF
jgi:hypothetical protein